MYPATYAPPPASISVLVDKATNELLPGPDWAANLEVCDAITIQGEHAAKEGVKAMRKKLNQKNAKVQMLTLTLLETGMKNCGESFHRAVATKDVLPEMSKVILKNKTTDPAVKTQIITLLKSWGEAFGQNSPYPQFANEYYQLQRRIDFPVESGASSGVLTPPPRAPTHVPNFSVPEYTLEPTMPPTSLGVPAMGVPATTARVPETEALRRKLREELNTGKNTVDLLNELLSGSDSNPEMLNDEVVVDVTQQCRKLQSRVMDIINTVEDEGIMNQALALNDDIQGVLERHEASVARMVASPGYADGGVGVGGGGGGGDFLALDDSPPAPPLRQPSRRGGAAADSYASSSSQPLASGSSNQSSALVTSNIAAPTAAPSPPPRPRDPMEELLSAFGVGGQPQISGDPILALGAPESASPLPALPPPPPPIPGVTVATAPEFSSASQTAEVAGDATADAAYTPPTVYSPVPQPPQDLGGAAATPATPVTSSPPFPPPPYSTPASSLSSPAPSAPPLATFSSTIATPYPSTSTAPSTSLEPSFSPTQAPSAMPPAGYGGHSIPPHPMVPSSAAPSTSSSSPATAPGGSNNFPPSYAQPMGPSTTSPQYPSATRDDGFGVLATSRHSSSSTGLSPAQRPPAGAMGMNMSPNAMGVGAMPPPGVNPMYGMGGQQSMYNPSMAPMPTPPTYSAPPMAPYQMQQSYGNGGGLAAVPPSNAQFGQSASFGRTGYYDSQVSSANKFATTNPFVSLPSGSMGGAPTMPGNNDLNSPYGSFPPRATGNFSGTPYNNTGTTYAGDLSATSNNNVNTRTNSGNVSGIPNFIPPPPPPPPMGTPMRQDGVDQVSQSMQATHIS